MKLEEIADSILHVNFPTQFDLTSTFLRFQEHFESPQFRGKAFTLQEFAEWYTANSENGKETGKFTYYTDWNGFNIPSYVLDFFYQGKFDPLSQKETDFLGLFSERKGTKFYVIGTHGSTGFCLKHEVAHALYYLNGEYKKEVQIVLRDLDPTIQTRVHDVLLNNQGYDSSVLEDEVHAHILDGFEKLQRYGIDTSPMMPIQSRLNELFYKHFKPTRPEVMALL